MKYIKPAFLLLVVSVFAFPSGSFAQKGFKLGIIALPQNTWLINSDDWNASKSAYDHRITLGMAGGIKAGINFGDGIGIKLDALYSLQGQRYLSLNQKNEEVQNNIRLQYVKLPLMLSFNTRTEYSKVIFAFAAGFEAGILTRARYFNNDQSYVPDQSLNSNILSYPSTWKTYRWLTYGPVAEIGVDIKLTFNIMANIRFRGDYMLGDAENKNAIVTKIESGIAFREPYWQDTRPATQQITGGILLGMTYTFTEY